MDLQQPEQQSEPEKLSPEQKESLIKQLEKLVAKESKIIITFVAVMALVITPMLINTLQATSQIKGTRIVPTVTPTATNFPS
jgi:hypothetical protein